MKSTAKVRTFLDLTKNILQSALLFVLLHLIHGTENEVMDSKKNGEDYYIYYTTHFLKQQNHSKQDALCGYSSTSILTTSKSLS